MFIGKTSANAGSFKQVSVNDDFYFGYPVNANTMAAVSETGNLMLKNVDCYLRVRLYGENTTISPVTLTTKGDETIAEEAKVTPLLQ